MFRWLSEDFRRCAKQFFGIQLDVEKLSKTINNRNMKLILIAGIKATYWLVRF